jgi:hypothetical protein
MYCLLCIQEVTTCERSLNCHFLLEVTWLGRAVAQAVSYWLPTAAARVGVRAGMWMEFVVDKAALGQVFCE